MKKKFTIYNLQFIIKLSFLLFTFYILHSTFYISTANAVESTPSGDIASKLKEFQKEAASKAAQLKDLITKRLQNKAFVGTLQSQSGSSLTLSVKSGPKMITINEDTVFESNVKSRKYFKENVSTGDYIAALGDDDETGVLTAKKIILEASPGAQPKTYLWGQIISISDQLVTLRGNDFKNIAATLPHSAKIKLNDSVILTGFSDKNDIFSAGYVYITATPSASN